MMRCSSSHSRASASSEFENFREWRSTNRASTSFEIREVRGGDDLWVAEGLISYDQGGVVGDANRFVVAVHRDDGSHGAEDLFAGDAHIGTHVSEDRWTEEPARSIVALAAEDESRTLTATDAYVLERRVELPLGNDRTDVRIWFVARPDSQRCGALDELVGELAQHLSPDEHPAGRRALLTGGGERPRDDLVGGEVEICVLKHD